MTTIKRKLQQRIASKKNRDAKQKNGWKRLWIPPSLLDQVRELISDYKG